MNYSNSDTRQRQRPGLSPDVIDRLELMRKLSRKARTHAEKMRLSELFQSLRKS